MTSQMTGQSTPVALPLAALGDEFAGIERSLEIGLRLAPVLRVAHDAATALAALLAESPAIPVRLAGLDFTQTRMHLTITIDLGSLDDIKVAAERSCAAVALIASIVDRLAAHEPCLVEIPHPDSSEAMRARGILVRDLPVRTCAAAEAPALAVRSS
ncbi:MAG: hypothetical protein PHU75_01915 [Candidatus Nanopelagicales bacterium]|nr:hypothetical protein [Candidatus Nanopelagicales bacterium]